MKKIIYIFIFSILFSFTYLINSKANDEEYIYEEIDLVYNQNFIVWQYYVYQTKVDLYFNLESNLFYENPYLQNSSDVRDNTYFYMYNFETLREGAYTTVINHPSIMSDVISGIINIPRSYFFFYYDEIAQVDENTFFANFDEYLPDICEYIKLIVKVKPKDKEDYLREYFYRMPPKTRPANLYYVGMAYRSGTVAAGRLYWWLDEYIDISNYIDEYKAFLSYTFVDDTYLYRLFFFDENQNQVATVFIPDYEEYTYKFENENRHVVGMLHFRDAYTNEYINFDTVKYMQFEYHTEPYPDSSVLINLTNTIDISIGEFWRNAEALNSYYQAGYNEGNMIGFAEGQEKIRSEIADMLKDEYDRGYEEGLEAAPDEAYERGYIKGANESFIGTMDKWLVPAIIIVMLLGGFFTIARKKQEGDI